MKYLAAIFVFNLLIAKSYARTLDCSSPHGQLQFSSWSYAGGAAPGAGMMSTKIQLIFKSQIVLEQKTYFPCDEQLCEEHPADPASNIVWNFKDSSRVIVEEIDTGWGYHKVFATIIEMKSSDGQHMTGMGVKEHQEWILCQEDFAILP